MKSITTAYLSFLLLWSVECLGATGLVLLQKAPAPVFSEGHTLLPLTRWAWPLTVEMNVELAKRWGYALDIDPGRVGKELDNPNSPASRMVAFSKSAPGGYPVSVTTRRVMFEWNITQSLLSPQAWCRQSDGTLVLRYKNPVMKPYVSDADAAAIGQAEVARLERLKDLGVTASVILNGAEYMPSVPGGDGSYWQMDPDVKTWLDSIDALPEAERIAPFASNKAKQEQAVRDAALSIMPNSQVIYYVTGDSLRGIVPEVNRLPWVWPYRYMINGGTVPSWQFYFGSDGPWFPATPSGVSMPLRATNSIAQGIEDGHPLSYNWVTAGWSLTDPGSVSYDQHYMGFLKYLYTLGSIGNVAGYFSYPPGGFNGDLGASPPDWLRQIMMLSHVHATFTHLESYLRNGDLLPGDGNHLYSIDLYGRPSWPHPAYEFTTNENSQSAHVAARKLKDKSEWLIVAWSAQGVDRNISVSIPDLGRVTLLARSEGSLYKATPGPTLELLDPDGMDPSRNVARLLAGTYAPTRSPASKIRVKSKSIP